MKTIRSHAFEGVAGTVVLLAALLGAPSVSEGETAGLPEAALDSCNVVWETPSTGPNGSMPLGNGEVGLNVWVEKDGDLLFYVSRTDSWSECSRLLKLGRVRVSFSPNPFAGQAPFRQELKLRQGRVEIVAGPVKLDVFAAADRPVIYVAGRSETPVEVKVSLENWRTMRHVLKGTELVSSWTMRMAPDNVEVWESPDVVHKAPGDAVAWYHRNAYSIVPFTLRHQSLESAASQVRDPLAHRTFGGWISAAGFVQAGKAALRSAKPVREFDVRIATHAAQTETAEEWLRHVEEISGQSPDAATAQRTTAAWWNDFWNRSWIFVEGDQADRVTRAYALQRWITACGGRGNYPIKFNGSIFTINPKYTESKLDFNADWRAWGDCYWWQNTRLPYLPMLARGDFDQMRPLFRFYREAVPLCRARAKRYHGVEGVYFPETMTIFGAYSNGDYGWDRTGREPKEVLCPYWQYAWQQGLELVMLMLDYYDHVRDDAFLTRELTPMAHDVLKYYDTRFRRDEHGKLVINPTQSAETYWYDVTNDTPSVAGLESVLSRLLALPADRVPAAERAYWTKMREAVPALPLKTEEGKTFILPAAVFNPKRSNCENPELYPISPFRLLGVGKPNLETGIETYQRRIAKATFGWSIDGHCAALLGMTEEAKRQLLARVGNSHQNHRFPAMWGPNYDWVPDQDHGGNLMLALQYMAMQADDGKIYLLPAWPKNWNVQFKLHAPGNTVVEADYREGKLAKLKVTPSERRKDVVVGPNVAP